jgi:polyisoprenyl-teichoic acid--peptidoglycan teichoic acid transferase
MPGKREAPSSRGQGSRRSSSRSQDAYFEQPRRSSSSRNYDAYYTEDYDADATRRYDTRSSDRRRDYERGYDDRRSSQRRPSDDRRSSAGSSSNRRPPNGGDNRKRKKKKRMPRWQKVIIIVLLVLILLLVTAIALVYGKLGKINRIQSVDRVSTSEQTYDQDTDAEDTLTDDQVDFGTTKVLEDQNVINILLVGRDSRDLSERGRSDSMIVLSMNRNTKQISMVSLMRDSYVKIPGYNNNKMNAAFSYGGYDLLDETISENFGIEIDYNVGVNFSGFEQVVDKLGGIDITLTQDEALYLMADEDTLAEGLVEGVNHLNGKEALGYARARYVSTGKEANDFGRTYRQRVVMTTVYKEMMKQSLTEIWSILDSIMDCVETDMTNSQIISIGTEFYNMGIDTMQSYRIPADGEYTDQTINKMSVLVLDFDKARENLQNWLYSDTPVDDHSLDTAN